VREQRIRRRASSPCGHRHGYEGRDPDPLARELPGAANHAAACQNDCPRLAPAKNMPQRPSASANQLGAARLAGAPPARGLVPCHASSSIPHGFRLPHVAGTLSRAPTLLSIGVRSCARGVWSPAAAWRSPVRQSLAAAPPVRPCKPVWTCKPVVCVRGACAVCCTSQSSAPHHPCYVCARHQCCQLLRCANHGNVLPKPTVDFPGLLTADLLIMVSKASPHLSVPSHLGFHRTWNRALQVAIACRRGLRHTWQRCGCRTAGWSSLDFKMIPLSASGLHWCAQVTPDSMRAEIMTMRAEIMTIAAAGTALAVPSSTGQVETCQHDTIKT